MVLISVLTSNNHNYQRTFPLQYNSNADSSSPIIVDKNQTNYNKKNQSGQIYLIVGTGGKSLYDIEEQATFVAKQSHDHFGFLNIDINGKTINGTFYSNENDNTLDNSNIDNNIVDQFTISKTY